MFTKELLILTLITFMLLILFRFPDIVASDETVYVEVTKEIYQNRVYKAFHPPGMFFLVYIFFLLFGVSNQVARLVDPVFGFFSVILIYLFGKALYNKKTGFLSGLFLLTSPSFLLLSSRILTEVPFLFFFIASLFTFYLGVEKNKKWLILCAILTTICFLIKFNGILIIFSYIFYLILNRKLKIIFTKEIGLSFLTVLAILIPYFINNYYVFGNPVYPMTKALRDVTTIETRPVEIYVTQLPAITGLLLLFAIFGGYLALKRKEKKGIWLFISLLFIYFFMFLIETRHIRYVFEIVMMFSILSAYFIFNIKNKKVYNFLIITIFLINLIGSIYVYNYFLTYPKHVESKDASLWAKNNCLQPILTNAGGFVKYYTDFDTISSTKENFYKYKEQVSCVLYSYYEGRDEEIENELRIIDKEYKFGSVSVYKLR